jgi:hypothetical protein
LLAEQAHIATGENAIYIASGWVLHLDKGLSQRASAGPIVHDIRNHLAIAIANVEAIADGKLEPTSKRLAVILEALRSVDALISGLRIVQRDLPKE